MDATFFSIRVVFNNFLLIDATDRSKISSGQKRLFFAVSLYLLSFFANTPFKLLTKTNCLEEEYASSVNLPNFRDILKIFWMLLQPNCSHTSSNHSFENYILPAPALKELPTITSFIISKPYLYLDNLECN